MTSILADKLEVWGFEDDIIIYSDGSLGFALEIKPLDIAYAEDESINGFSEKLKQFLNGLPDELDIQFLKEITKTDAQDINLHMATDSSGMPIMAEALCKERIDRLSALNRDGLLPKHRLTITLRRRLGSSLVPRLRIFSKERIFSDIAEEQMLREVRLTKQLQENVVGHLATLGFQTTHLGQEAIVERMYELWNPSRTVPLGGYNSDDIRSSILFSDVSVDPRGFSFGDIHYRILSLKMLPDQTLAGMSQALNDLPFGSQLYLSIHIPNQQKEMENLQTQRRLAYSLVSGRTNSARDIESEAKLADLEEILEEIVQGGEKVFRVSLNILLRSDSPDELNALASETIMHLRQLGGAELMEETVAAFDVFREFSFPNARAKERQRRLKTSNLADFLPVYGPWEGHKTSVNLFRTRGGNLFRFDPFSSELTNANQLISGGSGAGKSFLTNKILLQSLKDNPKVFIVDIGGSYKKLVESLGGQYIPLGVGGQMALNPLDLPTGESKPNEQKIKFLLGLIEIMTKEDDQTRLPRLERAELETAIQQVYEKVRSPLLSDLKAILVNHTDQSIKAIGRILSPWCGNSPFGRFVDRPTNIAISNSIICFDLKGLETHADLQAACLFIITDLVWREVQADRSTKKFLVFDECWKILENEAGATLVGEVFRTFRKYHASAIAISQTIDDFARSAVANAILPNSSTKWLLRQKGADRESLRETLSLNETEADTVDSLHQEKGKYSEAFLLAEDRRSVVLIESTPLEYWIATTDPRDLATIDEMSRKDPSRTSLDIFKSLSKSHPFGITASHS